MPEAILYPFILILLSLVGYVMFRGKRVHGAVARSGAISHAMHKRNAPIDSFLMNSERRKSSFKTWKFSKRHKKKLGRSNGIQTIPTKSSGDDSVPKSSFQEGVNL